jgi:hypothetical protein
LNPHFQLFFKKMVKGQTSKSTAAVKAQTSLKKKTGTPASPKAATSTRRPSSGPSNQNIRHLLYKTAGDYKTGEDLRRVRLTAKHFEEIKKQYFNLLRKDVFGSHQVLTAQGARVLTTDHVTKGLYLHSSHKYYCGPIESVIVKKFRSKKPAEEATTDASTSSSVPKKVVKKEPKVKEEKKVKEEEKEDEEEEEEEDEVEDEDEDEGF